MRKLLFPVALAMLCLSAPGFALDVNQPQATPEVREAQSFFESLMQTARNPIIASMARENLRRLTSVPERSDRGTSPQPKTIAEIQLLPQPDNTFVVPAVINRKFMATFLVDTGASYTVITPDLARTLGIRIDEATEMVPITTANGTVDAPIVTLNNVTLGGIQVNGVEAVVTDLGDNPQLSGLLGMSFFQGMELSFKQDRLVISR